MELGGYEKFHRQKFSNVFYQQRKLELKGNQKKNRRQHEGVRYKSLIPSPLQQKEKEQYKPEHIKYQQKEIFVRGISHVPQFYSEILLVQMTKGPQAFQVPLYSNILGVYVIQKELQKSEFHQKVKSSRKFMTM